LTGLAKERAEDPAMEAMCVRREEREREREREGGGGGHEERESDGEVAGRCWVGWSWSTVAWPERGLYTRRGGDAAAGIGRIDGRRGPRGRRRAPPHSRSWALGGGAVRE